MNGGDDSGAGSPAPSSLEGQAPLPVDLGLPQLSNAVEIGRGAAGVVYRAEQPSINRTVAVKMMPYASMDDAAKARFERETRAMGALSSHPSIVTVYDAGFAPSGQPYIIMELMEGGSYGDRLVQGRLGWEEVVDVGVKVAGALEAAHRKGVLHRDIKPDNVLISSYGEPKLADFSIARLHGAQQTQTGLISATPAHAAPEILRGDPPTERADVYSLGSTLLTLLLGSPAFVRETDTSIFPVLARVERDPVPDLRPLGVPDEVCRVIERAMAKDPAHRQQSAAEFAAELRSARDAAKGVGTARIGPAPPPVPGATVVGLSPMAAPSARGAVGTQPGGVPAARRGPSRALLIGAAVVLVALVGGVVAVLASRGGSSSTASSSSSSSTSRSSTRATTGGAPGVDLSRRLIGTADLASGFADFDKSDSLSAQAPCNQPPPLDGLGPEKDAAFDATQQADNSLVVVNVSVGQFQAGKGAAFLTALAAASGACGQYTALAGGIQTTNTVSKVGEGAVLGDQTMRYSVTSSNGTGINVVTEVVGMRKGDLVALVSVTTTGTPDPGSVERIAQAEAAKLSAP